MLLKQKQREKKETTLGKRIALLLYFKRMVQLASIRILRYLRYATVTVPRLSVPVSKILTSNRSVTVCTSTYPLKLPQDHRKLGNY